MIRIFGTTDTLFSTNGDVVVRPLKAKVRKEDNGAFYLDLEAGLEYADYITADRIVVANTPQGDQAFRITNPTKAKTKIITRALHVFYDARNYLIEDTFVVDKNCNAALDQLNTHTDTQSPFSTLSDIGTVNSYRCVRKSLYEAIQTVIERWGGHLVRNNFSIAVRAEIGQDNGVTVRYGKNIKEITAEEQWDNVCTKLLPVGKDGILLNDIDASASIYVLSRTTYDIPYTKTVSFNQDDVLTEYYKDASGNLDETAYRQALVDDLRLKAESYIEANNVPKVNYTLKANLEKITDVGDTIHVEDERLGINVLTNVIAYEYDCILDRYTELEFGNFKPTLSGLMNTIKAETEKIVDDTVEKSTTTLTRELEQATDRIWGVMGNSFVKYDGDKILVLDNEDPSQAQNVMIINREGIGFSQNGIGGTFNSAWTIDGQMDMQKFTVINLIADLIKGGTLKLGNVDGSNGVLELYDSTNNLIADMTTSGIKVYGRDGSYVLMNNTVGFAGYDMNGNEIYWAAKDEFHMEKAVVENEITLCGKLRFIPITITSGSTVVNDGIGLVPFE